MVQSLHFDVSESLGFVPSLPIQCHSFCGNDNFLPEPLSDQIRNGIGQLLRIPDGKGQISNKRRVGCMFGEDEFFDRSSCFDLVAYDKGGRGCWFFYPLSNDWRVVFWCKKVVVFVIRRVAPVQGHFVDAVCALVLSKRSCFRRTEGNL